MLDVRIVKVGLYYLAREWVSDILGYQEKKNVNTFLYGLYRNPVSHSAAEQVTTSLIFSPIFA